MPTVQIQMRDLDRSPRVEHEDAPCVAERCCTPCREKHNERLQLLGKAAGLEKAAEYALARAAELWTNSEEEVADQLKTFAIAALNEEARVTRVAAMRFDLSTVCTHGAEEA